MIAEGDLGNQVTSAFHRVLGAFDRCSRLTRGACGSSEVHRSTPTQVVVKFSRRCPSPSVSNLGHPPRRVSKLEPVPGPGKPTSGRQARFPPHGCFQLRADCFPSSSVSRRAVNSRGLVGRCYAFAADSPLRSSASPERELAPEPSGSRPFGLSPRSFGKRLRQLRAIGGWSPTSRIPMAAGREPHGESPGSTNCDAIGRRFGENSFPSLIKE